MLDGKMVSGLFRSLNNTIKYEIDILSILYKNNVWLQITIAAFCHNSSTNRFKAKFYIPLTSVVTTLITQLESNGLSQSRCNRVVI